jgi:beta-lactamase regulating signal transducer with metallopeptidase domain
VAFALRQRSAAAQHRVWTLGMIGLLVIPIITLAGPVWNWRIVTARAEAPVSERSLGPRPERTTLVHTSERSGRGPMLQEVPPPLAIKQPITTTAAPFNWSRVTVLFWAITALVVIARFAWRHVVLLRMLNRCRECPSTAAHSALQSAAQQLGVTLPIRLLESAETISPLTAGTFRPVVVLPADAQQWPAEKMTAVLLHELAHIKRRDVLTQLVASGACALNWFNPLAWYGAAQMRRLRELACDDLVLSSGQRASDYAAVLLDVAGRYRHPQFAGAVNMAPQANVDHRITAILDAARNRLPLSRRAARGLAAAMVAVVVGVGTMRVESRAEATLEKQNDPKASNETPASEGRTMEVLITDEAGRPLPEASVLVNAVANSTAKDRITTRTYQVDQSGIANVSLPKSICELRMWPSTEGYVPFFLMFREGTHDDGDQIPTKHHFKLVKGTRLSGTVVDEEGQPISGVKVAVQVQVREPEWGASPDPMISCWLTDDDFQNGAAITDANGRWFVTNAPAQNEKQDYQFLLSITHEEYVRDLQWGQLQQEQGITTAMLRDGSAKMVLAHGQPIVGTIRDQAGQPATEGLVIWNDDPYLAHGINETQIDEQGRFKTIPLQPGEYPITVVAPGFAPERRMVKVHAELEPQDFTLVLGRKLHLKIVDPDGNALAGAYVVPTNWCGSKSLYNEIHPDVPVSGIPRSSDAEGRFVWDWAPVDFVVYTVGAKGFQDRQVALMAEGEEIVIELDRNLKAAD